MRLLAVIIHFFEHAQEGEARLLGASSEPLARIAAMNATLVALHRHFGPRRHGHDPTQRLPGDETPERVLDIVVLQSPGHGLLDWIGLDASLFAVEPCDCPPVLLAFEAQRILRERLDAYDYYFVVEDDHVIHDPLFIDKLAWFEQQFGPRRLLRPTRYEMSHSGTPALVSAWPTIPTDLLVQLGLRRPGQPAALTGRWHGREQSFVLPANPHAGGYFVSNAQLSHWVTTPWFYDRDTSFVGPMESATALSLGRAFDVYEPSRPDPFFLSIEHWGTRYAKRTAPAGLNYGDPPLLDIAHAAIRMAAESQAGQTPTDPQARLHALFALTRRRLNALLQQRDAIQHELTSLKRSRSKLLKTFFQSVWNKGRG
jgi:hypothetical protein